MPTATLLRSMETFIRERAKRLPAYRSPAVTDRRLGQSKKQQAAIQNLKEKANKTYEAGVLHTDKADFNTNVSQPLFRRTFPEAKLRNQDVLAKALQSPASLAGLQMTKHLGLPGPPPIINMAPPPPMPMMPPPGMFDVRDQMREDIVTHLDATRKKAQRDAKSAWRRSQRYKNTGDVDDLTRFVKPPMRK